MGEPVGVPTTYFPCGQLLIVNLKISLTETLTDFTDSEDSFSLVSEKVMEKCLYEYILTISLEIKNKHYKIYLSYYFFGSSISIKGTSSSVTFYLCWVSRSGFLR